MSNSIATVIPYLVLISNIAFVLFVVAVIAKSLLARRVINFVGERALVIGLLISLLPWISLFYSEVVGFEPCVLCWWQRVFLFPLPILFGIALWKKDNKVFNYMIPMAVLAGVIGFYQSYVNWGGSSLLPCTAVGGACSRVYVNAFGYITIPFMSLTISIYILTVAWIKKRYDKNRNA